MEYAQSSRDHGTLAFFRNRLNRISVTKDPKKDVNTCVDFLYTVVKGHYLACACEILGVTSLDNPLTHVLPPGIQSADKATQLAFIEDLARKVVERCSIIEESFTGKMKDDFNDGAFNYARVLCHFGSLVMEFRDAWAEGDGERVTRCWKLFMPHFLASGCRKYSLEALRLNIQINTLSPNLAHQVTWHRFVNSKGGAGRNIPCDLHNEHVNKHLKSIIRNMGSNLTEASLQRAARCVTTMHQIAEKFDAESGVPHVTAHGPTVMM